MTATGPPTDPDPRDDARLVADARAGDHTAFAALYRRHRDWSLAVAFRFTHNQADAADAVQDAFVYVARKLPSLNLTARFTTFLYPVLRSSAVTVIRKRRLRELGGAEAADARVHTEPPPTDDPDLQPLRRALLDLSPAQREIVELHYVREMPLTQIALVLSIPLGTVKSRLHHALRALREHPDAAAWFEPDPPE